MPSLSEGADGAGLSSGRVHSEKDTSARSDRRKIRNRGQFRASLVAGLLLPEGLDISSERSEEL